MLYSSFIESCHPIIVNGLLRSRYGSGPGGLLTQSEPIVDSTTGQTVGEVKPRKHRGGTHRHAGHEEEHEGQANGTNGNNKQVYHHSHNAAYNHCCSRVAQERNDRNSAEGQEAHNADELDRVFLGIVQDFAPPLAICLPRPAHFCFWSLLLLTLATPPEL